MRLSDTIDVEPLGPWDQYPRMSCEALLAHFPSLAASIDEDEARESTGDPGHFLSWHENDDFIVVSGNVHISQARLEELSEQYRTRVVIDGSVDVEGKVKKISWVNGDLHCDTIWLGDDPLYVAGTIYARAFVCLCAWDDGGREPAPYLRVATPFVFAWFYEVDNLILCTESVIFVLSAWEYSQRLKQRKLVFAWHDCMHVLADRYTMRVGNDGSDEICWNLDTIELALAKGLSIFKPGYELASDPWQRAGDAAMDDEDWQRAFLLFRQSAMLSPGYYAAWYGMGMALFNAWALNQALDAFRRAAALFPADQRGLVNDALNMAALCALHRKQLALAQELASASIRHNAQAQAEDSRSYYARALRLRGEVRMMLGHPDLALADLVQAIHHDPHCRDAHWLRGKILFDRGDHAAAAECYAETVRSWGEPYQAFAGADNLAWTDEGVSVDWKSLTTPSLPASSDTTVACGLQPCERT